MKHSQIKHLTRVAARVRHLVPGVCVMLRPSPTRRYARRAPEPALRPAFDDELRGARVNVAFELLQDCAVRRGELRVVARGVEVRGVREVPVGCDGVDGGDGGDRAAGGPSREEGAHGRRGRGFVKDLGRRGGRLCYC